MTYSLNSLKGVTKEDTSVLDYSSYNMCIYVYIYISTQVAPGWLDNHLLAKSPVLIRRIRHDFDLQERAAREQAELETLYEDPKP